MFKTNVGGVDRGLRIIAGVALLAAWFFMPGFGYRWAFALFGVIALLTGLMSTCPLYSVLGISTCPTSKS
jgi:membrane-bound ClpP family serine protease